MKATSLQEFIIAKIKYDLAKKYFLKAKEKSPKTILDNYLINSLYSWSDLKGKNIEEAISNLQKLDDRFSNLKKIQNVFLYFFLVIVIQKIFLMNLFLIKKLIFLGIIIFMQNI